MTKMKRRIKWNTITWHEIAQKVLNIQIIIFEASKIGNTSKVHIYQNAILNMYEAKLLAVRRVTQDNKGKKTPGVDGVKNLNGKERIDLANKLKIDGKTRPIKQIWIPKPGTTEKKPLGISTITDRAKQQLVKLAVEPQWEAKFEPTSLGFRPGRGTMDAIHQVRSCLYNSEKYILDADIRKCFDRIDHDVLLQKANASPTITRQLETWLKAGILDPDISTDPVPNQKGTPQGQILSPVLCNIALHGMEERMLSKYSEINKSLKNEKKYRKEYLSFIRYADDFVVIHPSFQVILKIKEVISEFLKEIGLELNEEKTKIRNSLNTITYNNQIIKPGLEYLGVFFRLYNSKASSNLKIGKIGTSKIRSRSLLNFRTVPTNESIRNHLNQIRITIKESRGLSQEILIRKLSPIINGWTLFYQYTHSKKVFSSCDHKMFWMLVKWCYIRHNNMGKRRILSKYFIEHRGRKWTFGLYNQGRYPKVLPFHAHRNISNYQKVKKEYTPYSLEQVTTERNFKLNKTATNLFKSQKGICKFCLYPFYTDDLLEIHHTLPKEHPRREWQTNKWLIHRHCHDQLHALHFYDFYPGFEKDPLLNSEKLGKQTRGPKGSKS